MYDPIPILLIVLGLFFCRSFPSLVFPAQRSYFSICCKTGLVVPHSLNFCLSEKLLISLSNLNESLTGQSILDCRFLPFISLNVSCHFLLACRVSAKKSADKLIVPLYVVIFLLLLLIFFSCSLFLFPCDLMTNFSVVFHFLFLFIYCRFLLCGYREDLLQQSMQKQDCFKLLIFSSAFPISCIRILSS